MVAFYNVFVGSLWLFSLSSPDLGMFISLRMTYSLTFLPAVSIANVPFRSDQTQQERKENYEKNNKKEKKNATPRLAISLLSETDMLPSTLVSVNTQPDETSATVSHQISFHTRELRFHDSFS